ncbi:MAG: gliding motility-associated C-terminal domain-containing protein [Bacteroidales bacterium]|nr:gliding motility-associated C-terminal domain-containing protein [Bacteroidales bacterium]
MKKILLLIFLFGGFYSFTWEISAQITIFTENFDNLPNGIISNTTPVEGWLANSTRVQHTDGDILNDSTCQNHTYCRRNLWTIYDGGTNPSSSISNKSAGISAFEGCDLFSQFNYWVTATANVWIMHPLNFQGYKDVNLKFKWKCTGDYEEGVAYDYGSVWIATIDNGDTTYTMITSGGVNNSGKYYMAHLVQDADVYLPASFNNKDSLLLSFRWTSNEIKGSVPSFIIDDIIVTACPDGGEISPLVTTFPTSGSTTLTVSGVVPGASYQWENAPTASGPWTAISGATSPSYTTPIITVTTYFRCRISNGTCNPSYQTPASVNMGTDVIASITSDPVNDTICAGDKADFDVLSNGTDPLFYMWEVSEDNGLTWSKVKERPYTNYNTNALSIISVPESYNENLYRCIISNNIGNDTSAFAKLVIKAPPVVNAGADTTINPSTVAMLNVTATGGVEPYTYSWSPTSSLNIANSPMVLATPTETTTYTVYVTDKNGCASSDKVVVYINSKIKLTIPNVITPNNDMINDVFDIQAEGVTKMKVSIFNRWGKVITKYDGMEEKWDGRLKSGELVTEGTYFYYIEVANSEGEENHYSGSLTVLFN